MAAIQSILELMTSPYGSDTMKYCFSKVLLKLQSQNCVDVNYKKTVGLGAWLTKTL